MNNSPEDSGGYSSAAFGSLCTAFSPAARFDRHFVLSCGRNRKFKLPRIHIIAEINRFIALRSDDNIDPSLFNFKLNRNHITRFGFVNLYAQSSEIRLRIVCVSRCCEYIGDVLFAVYGSAVKTEEAFRFAFPVHKSASGSVVRAFTVRRHCCSSALLFAPILYHCSKPFIVRQRARAKTFKSSPLQRWSAHLRQNGMTTTCK